MGILNRTTISSNQQTEKEPLDGNTTQDKIDPSIYDRLKDVQIVFIKEIINPKLYKKLFLNGMTNIKSILDTRVIEFLAKPSIGKTLSAFYSEFRMKAINDPSYILEIYQKNKIKQLPLRFNSENSIKKYYFLELFKLIINDYFNLVKSTRDKSIVFKRFGINSENEYTFEDLGLHYNLSKEYIRKIQESHLKKLKALFDLKKVDKPECEIYEPANSVLKNFLDIFKDEKLITKHELYEKLKTKYAKEFNADDWAYLVLFFRIMGYRKYSIKESDFFIRDKEIEINKLKDVTDAVYSILNDEVKPISDKDLDIKTKKKLKVKKFEKPLVKYAIRILAYEYVEISKTNEDEMVKLRFENLSSLSNMAYRILYEQKKNLDLKFITRYIKQKLSKNSNFRDISDRSVGNQLSTDKRFVSIGKTGEWALKEWNIDSSPIIKLIKRALSALNQPSTKNEIIQKVKSYRNNVNTNSIYIYLTDRKGHFRKIDKKYILKEWEDRNRKVNVKEQNKMRKLPVPLEKLMEIIVEVFSEKEFREMTNTELKKGIQNKIVIGNSTLENRLPHLNILSFEKKENKKYYKLHGNYREMMTDGTIKRGGKINYIEETIIKILKSTLNNAILYRDLVNILKNKHNLALGTIYHVIQKKNKIRISKNEDGKKCITLFENIDLIKAEKLKMEEILNLIKAGENDIIEFKSSIRYDYKINNINKALEYVIAKTIAGFLNSKGGKLIIGVNDSGVILGLKNDYNTLSKKNSDGFLQMLTNIIINYIGKDFFMYLTSRILKIDEMDICVIDIERSGQPAYVKHGDENEFFIRTSATTRKMNVKEAVNYISLNWKVKTLPSR